MTVDADRPGPLRPAILRDPIRVLAVRLGSRRSAPEAAIPDGVVSGGRPGRRRFGHCSRQAFRLTTRLVAVDSRVDLPARIRNIQAS